MSTTYRAAVIGCGGMGACHARAYKQVEQVELVAAVDPLAAARDQFQQDVGVPQVFATTEEMLGRGAAGPRERLHLAPAPPGPDGCGGTRWR